MYKKPLHPGLSFTKTVTVSYKDTAAALGSGNVEVFATPSMIALMEAVALETVRPFLADGYATVGTEVCVKHVKATPVGMKVTCRAVLTAVDGAKLTFEVEARDEEGKIGVGTHKRYVVYTPEFPAKKQ